MVRSNLLYYCTFFDNRNQQTVLDHDGLRLCLLINSEDFVSLLPLGITIIISAIFHDPANTYFDDKDVSCDNALIIAKDNAKKLLATLSLS